MEQDCEQEKERKEVGRLKRREKSVCTCETETEVFPLTISIQHHETCHHEDRVPVKLQRRSIPGKSSSPDPTPQTHEYHTQKPEPHAQQVEEHRETHLKQETKTMIG